MGLDLDKIKTIQNLVRCKIRRSGHVDAADDASQQYLLEIIENKKRFQSIDYFCLDYVRKHYPGNAKDKAINYGAEKLREGAGVSEQEKIEMQVDYNKIMGMIFDIEKSQHKRVMMYYYLFGLSVSDIAIKEKVSISRICKVLSDSLSFIKKSVL